VRNVFFPEEGNEEVEGRGNIWSTPGEEEVTRVLTLDNRSETSETTKTEN